MTAADAERDARADDARPGKPARVDRVAERDVAEMRAAHDPDGGEARLQGLLSVGRTEQHELAWHLGEAAVLPVAVADGAAGEVHMRVDEPRQHRFTRQVDHRRAPRDRDVRAGRRDALALDHDDRVLDRRRPGSLYY